MTTDKEEPAKANYSITQMLLIKTYGEPMWNEHWPETVDSGGFIILGSKAKFNYKKREMEAEPASHTWCWWGWDAGRPVRFDSPVDAEAFVKTLSLQDENGKQYSRGNILSVVDANVNNSLKEDDGDLPYDDSDEE